MKTNNEIFSVYLDSIIYQPIKHTVQLKNKLYKTNIVCERLFINKEERIKIIDSASNLDRIFSLGGSICNQVFNWNRNLEDKSFLDLISKYDWDGNNEDYVLHKIAFPDSYMEQFPGYVRTDSLNYVNAQYKHNKLKTDLGDPNNLKTVILKYNNEFGTDFLVSKIEEVDQMYFGNIEFEQANVIDVFCLGFELQLTEELIYQKLRNSNI